jgi:hypothetical protein
MLARRWKKALYRTSLSRLAKLVLEPVRYAYEVGKS